MSSYEDKFKECMEQLGKMHERSKVYVDFMDYYIHENSNSPQRVLPHGYKDEEMQLFREAYTNFCSMMKELIEEHGWYDYIGEYYEAYVLAGSKASDKGQYYTPRAISDLISQLVGTPVCLGEAYDPACGSARNLLDYHSKHPSVRLLGEDLDESACKMAVINFHCHDVDGVVNWIDALTREYMGVSWRVLRGGDIYITDLETIRVNDEILESVSILSLSDDVIRDMFVGVARALQNNTSEDNTDENSKKDDSNDVLDDIVTPIEKTNNNNGNGGLDEWL